MDATKIGTPLQFAASDQEPKDMTSAKQSEGCEAFSWRAEVVTERPWIGFSQRPLFSLASHNV